MTGHAKTLYTFASHAVAASVRANAGMGSNDTQSVLNRSPNAPILTGKAAERVKVGFAIGITSSTCTSLMMSRGTVRPDFVPCSQF